MSVHPESGGYPPVRLTRELATRTHLLLRTFQGTEGLVYWAGVPDRRGGTVTTLVVPKCNAHHRRVETSSEANAEAINTLSEYGIVLLGQAHSHPPGAAARHSKGDDLFTFSPFEGHVSVVVANFARGDFDPRTWGVHRFMSGAYRFVPAQDHQEHLHILPTQVDHRS